MANLLDASRPRRGPPIPVWLLAAACVAATAAPGLASDLRRSAIVKAVERVRPSIVNIQGEKTITPGPGEASTYDVDRRVNGMGTGVVLDPRGYIITNQHVIEGVQTIQVTLADGRTQVARVISHDLPTDLAIIKIDTDARLPAIDIGSSSDLMIGETVIAVGNAFGYQHTVTCGIISALDRTVEVSEGLTYEDLIQTDASINPGNSGGPLLNIDGEMIGINVAVRAGAQGIGFAIPSDKATDIAADLLSTRRLQDAWHGVVADPRPGAPGEGLVIRAVDADSPAERSGLQPGDRIVRVGDTAVERSLDLERALLGRRLGEEVPIALERDDQTIKLHLALAATPGNLRVPDDPIWDLLGLRLRPVSPKQFRDYGTRYRGGLMVLAVRPGGAAERQGIRRGDVLVGMHVWETVSLDNVAYILNREDIDEISPVKFYILRGRETLYGHLTLATHTRR